MVHCRIKDLHKNKFKNFKKLPDDVYQIYSLICLKCTEIKNGNALIFMRKFDIFYLLSNMLSNIYNGKEFLSLMSNLAITAFIDGKGILTMHFFY